MNFISHFSSEQHSLATEPANDSIVMCFHKDKVVLNQRGELPNYQMIKPHLLENETLLSLGDWNNKSCYLLVENETERFSGVDWQWKPVRERLAASDELFNHYFHTAYHLYHWHRKAKFCGSCGHPLNWMQEERGKICPQCQAHIYPRINPCVIVAVVKNNNAILLAEITRNQRKFSSVLAGYAEAGESLEHCVQREVKEEVGIDIKNIRYFGSQAWSFSQSIMIAYTAEYDSGLIQVDGKEVKTADWYTLDNLPALPPQYSIARELVEWFRNTYSKT